MNTANGHRPPRVWVVSELYYPEETSTGYFLTGIAEGLAEDHDVSVVCGQPTYSKRGTRAPRREQHRDVDIHRVRGTTLNKDVAALRVLNMITLGVAVFVHLLRHLRRGDVALVVTTPPLLPPLVLAACRLRGVRPALIVHDVYPDVLVAAGWLARTGTSTRVLNWAFARVYGSAQRISVLGRDMQALIAGKLAPARARDVVLIPNWWEPELTPNRDAGRAFRESLGLSGRFVVQYAGNLGPLHGAEMLVTAAQRLATEAPDVHFLFLGGGSRTGWLRDRLAASGLRNCTVLEKHLPRSEQQAFLSAADLAVMSFRPGMLGVGVPSRAYNIMAVGCPMAVAMNQRAEVAAVIAEEQLGWVVPEEDGAALSDVILEARDHPERLSAMGTRARQTAERRFSMDAALTAYRALVEDLGRA